MIRSLVRRLVPVAARQEIVALRETLADGWRYQRASSDVGKWTRKSYSEDRHEGRLTADYHRLEKGLALPQPKRPFGAAVHDRMAELLEHQPVREVEPAYIAYSRHALGALQQWNETGEIDKVASPVAGAPFRLLSEEQARDFFTSRHSIRNFDGTMPPTDEELRQGVELARNTPSVCNRQAFRVHFYRDRSQINAILAIQNGATGFADSVTCLGVVTARRAMFIGPDERNQRWVDGGLFAMTLVWAFHAVGLATCMLNWALPGVSSAKLRKVADIPEGEDIVVLIAIGHAQDGARTARSEKREVDDLAWFHS